MPTLRGIAETRPVWWALLLLIIVSLFSNTVRITTVGDEITDFVVRQLDLEVSGGVLRFSFLSLNSLG